MTISINMPSGDVLHFEDGTSRDTINQAIDTWNTQHAPPASAWDTAKQYGGLALSGLGSDLMWTPGMERSGWTPGLGKQVAKDQQAELEKLTGKWAEPAPGNAMQQYAYDVGRASPLALTGNVVRPFTAALGFDLGRSLFKDTPYEKEGKIGGGVLGALAPELWPVASPVLTAALGYHLGGSDLFKKFMPH